MSWLRVLPVLVAVIAIGCDKRSLDPEHDGGTGMIGSGSGGVASGGTGVGGSSNASADARPDIPPITSNLGTCGNGRPDPGEECDDGNKTPGDGCNSICQIECFESCGACGIHGPCVVPGCGNGWLEPGEQCDDANRDPADGCSNLCMVVAGWRCPAVGHRCVPICGDGLVVGLETCDDGNAIAGDGCSDFCVAEPTMARCGDGIREGAEECDPTGSESEDRGCTTTCRYDHICGDGVVNLPLEQCDLGPGQNRARYGNTGGCTQTCMYPHFCGDAHPDVENGEQCDLGSNNGMPGQPCTLDCKICVDCAP